MESRSNGSEPEPMKRLTIDVPESLHRAIKAQCAMRGTKIADEVRELLLQKYGNH
nr:plasmid partition protein ParG [Escherichia coli]